MSDRPDTPKAVSGRLDDDALGRLRELDPAGRTGLVGRVMRAFDTSARRLRSSLHDARVTGDLLGIRHVVHTLKSSSASIGALHLSALCAEIENMIRNESTERLDSHVGAMELELELVLEAIKPLLGPTP
jgi:HPt (histidine-containing phosphotransfer) domain-containing protein